MWAVWSVVAVFSIFENIIAQNHNETAQNETDHDFTGGGASFTRNLSASISVSDADSAVKSLQIPIERSISNVSAVRSSANSVGKLDNLIEFNTPNSSTKTNQKLDTFRPSPQLETYFEYNNIPVKPVHPEAKTIPRYGAVTSEETEGRDLSSRRDVLHAENNKQRIINSFAPATSFNAFQQQSFSSPKYDNPEQVNSKGNEVSAWITKNGIQKETPWVSRVRFPSGEAVIQPAQNDLNVHSRNAERVQSRPDLSYPTRNEYNDKPQYPAVSQFSSIGNDDFRNRFSSAGSNGGRFDFNKLVEVPKRHFDPYYAPQQSPKIYETGYNLMEKPSYDIHEKTYEGGYGMSNSWKKILKLLATFIPIGLLISALTPTVLTVTNVNDTSNAQSTRYRSNDDTKRELHSQILSSLDYFDKLNENGCEYRVFCELLVTARHMPNSEQHVQNLFDNLANQDKDYRSRAEELMKVFEAVRNEDCNLIACDFINNPP